MSGFFSKKYAALTPYTPGEQPNDMRYIKLNTNESPYPPSEKALRYAAENARIPNLYPQPDDLELGAAVGALYGLGADETMLTNGSDEGLNFAFMAYCDEGCPALFPDVTYGFYPVFAELNRVPMIEVPLREDFSVCIEDYLELDGTVFLANPNAPTGIALKAEEIERMLRARPDRMHVIDEAYVDFGAESVLPLVHKYENLLVIQTFSKSRSLAGARLGFAAGQAPLIRDLNTLKYSTNPYNVNRMTSAAGTAAIREDEYYRHNAQVIMENRAWTAKELKRLGFEVTDSRSNFLFARSPALPGGELYRALKERGILVRHLKGPRLDPFVRITIGMREQMEALIRETEKLLKTEAREDA